MESMKSYQYVDSEVFTKQVIDGERDFERIQLHGERDLTKLDSWEEFNKSLKEGEIC